LPQETDKSNIKKKLV